MTRLHRKPFRFIFLLGFLTFAGNLTAVPIRVLLPPVRNLRRPEPIDNARGILLLILTRRLSQFPNIKVVSPGRSMAVLNEMSSGKRYSAPGQLLDDFNQFLRVDVLVAVRSTAEELFFTVHKESGKKLLQQTVQMGNVREVVFKCAKMLADQLSLSEEQTKLLLTRRFKDTSVFVPYYRAQLETAPWPKSTGELRLKLLGPTFAKHQDDPLLAGQIIDHAHTLFAENRKRDKDYGPKGLRTAEVAMGVVLGTKSEKLARGIVKLHPGSFEEDLLEFALPLSKTEELEDGDVPLDEGDMDGGDELGLDSDLKETVNLPGAMGKAQEASLEVRLSALRLLGVMASERAMKIMEVAALNKDPRIRSAVAEALEHYPEEVGLDILKMLAGDEELGPAFAATLSLEAREKPTGRLLELARKAFRTTSSREAAAKILTVAGMKEDLEIFKELSSDDDADLRRMATIALVKHDAGGPVMELLDHPEESIILFTLSQLPKDASIEIQKKVQRLANDPLDSIARASRLALAPFRPKKEQEQWMFDLAIEHPYVRKRIVEKMADLKSEWGMSALEAACEGSEAHSRALALKKLMGLNKSRGRKVACKAITDPYRWVRLHAAALMEKHAGAEDAASINKAIESEKNEAIRLYLEDALARAEGRPPAPLRPAARSVKGKKNLTWLCGVGLDGANSPYDAYYRTRTDVNDKWKKAHDAGKIFFGRGSNIPNPGTIIVDPNVMNQFWMTMDAEFTQSNLPWLDGIIYGEESMGASPDTLWAKGWRLFCLEAKIDPARVNGKMENLSKPESVAWVHWAQTRIIEGFNLIYDYAKLKFGKIKPGLQIGTFLPEQGGPNQEDRSWKFDIGGVYDYKGCNRMAAYNMIRRNKTIWPDRPVLWLSLGIGGYEMNPVKRTQRVPTSPILTRRRRAWADTISAYVAGGDSGWFSVWIFVGKNFRGGMKDLSGPKIVVEDIFPGSPDLEGCIASSFRGTLAERSLQNSQPTLKVEIDEKAEVEPGLDAGGDDEGEDTIELALTGEMSEKDKINLQIKRDKQRFRQGFHFYRNYLYDCARILRSLPRQNPKPPALTIRTGGSVWTRPRIKNPLIPGQALLTSYDYLSDINKIVDLDHDRYRMIVVRSPGLLRDATISTIDQWLKKHPGLLYVNRTLSASNEDEASTIEDLDGTLKNDWPWEKEVRIKLVESANAKAVALKLKGPDGDLEVNAHFESTFGVSGGNAKILLSKDGKPCLVLWKDPAGKGAVLFDGIESAGGTYLQFLMDKLNELHKTSGIGMELKGPMLHQVLESDGLTAAAATGYYRHLSKSHSFEGVDLLTGEAKPTVGSGRQGTLIAKEFKGQHLVSLSGITVLSEKPIEKVEKIQGGLRIVGEGLMHAGSDQGSVRIIGADGKELPPVEDPSEWIPFGNDVGAVSFPIGKSGSEITYFRVDGKVQVLKSKPKPIPIQGPK
ncbi:MAG: hypothetical protein QF473_04265 [Planctomycetota bacterium]|nr:hypothetical protein [Planctomycetota bacterium]